MSDDINITFYLGLLLLLSLAVIAFLIHDYCKRKQYRKELTLWLLGRPEEKK